jgi:hypothetical protein
VGRCFNICCYDFRGSVLLVPSPVHWSHLKSSKWGVNFIKNKFLSPSINSNNYSRRIYISRQNANCRKVINESEFLPFLETLGFQTLCLEYLPFQEQVGYFANAEIIIVGTKCDLEKDREVYKDDVDNFAKIYNLDYYEVSSLKNINIKEIFNFMGIFFCLIIVIFVA